jgi:hypothetical protein
MAGAGAVVTSLPCRRARADSVAQKQQLEHQRQLSKELAAAGRAAREALGKMAEQNARLVAAYASTKQQLQALQVLLGPLLCLPACRCLLPLPACLPACLLPACLPACVRFGD